MLCLSRTAWVQKIKAASEQYIDTEKKKREKAYQGTWWCPGGLEAAARGPRGGGQAPPSGHKLLLLQRGLNSDSLKDSLAGGPGSCDPIGCSCPRGLLEPTTHHTDGGHPVPALGPRFSCGKGRRSFAQPSPLLLGPFCFTQRHVCGLPAFSSAPPLPSRRLPQPPPRPPVRLRHPGPDPRALLLLTLAVPVMCKWLPHGTPGT